MEDAMNVELLVELMVLVLKLLAAGCCE